MHINSEHIAIFRDFIQKTNSIDDAQQFLKDYRNIKIGDYNIKDSRCILLSLMLYKFKQEMDVSDSMWSKSRQLIISILRSNSNFNSNFNSNSNSNSNSLSVSELKSIIVNYLQEFEVWQKEDLVDLVIEIGGNYYNLIQIKKSIENTKNAETINQWIPHYEKLINKIRSYCRSIGI
jgi:hypothetical protein